MNTRPPRERESKVQRSIIVRLRHRFGIVLYRRNVMLARTPDGRKYRMEAAGRSDLYGWSMQDGRHYEIETKALGEHPTEAQTEWLRECTRLGAVALWGDNINDIERCVEAITNGGFVVWDDGYEFHIEMP